MEQLAIPLAKSKYLNLSLRLCKAQGTKYPIKYLKTAKNRNYIDFTSFPKYKNSLTHIWEKQIFEVQKLQKYFIFMPEKGPLTCCMQ